MTTDYSTRHAIIYGTGGHARVVADVLDGMGVEVSAQLTDEIITDSHPETVNPQPGVRDTDPRVLAHLIVSPLVTAIGSNVFRQIVVDRLEEIPEDIWLHPLRFGIAVDMSAIVAPRVVIGEGTVVLHGAIIQVNTTIGKHCIINTGASVDHDNVIGDYVHISPHATLCGNVEVGEGTHIGAGATIIPGVKIGKWCTVGAGAVVIEDIQDGVTAVGVPARHIKQHQVA